MDAKASWEPGSLPACPRRGAVGMLAQHAPMLKHAVRHALRRLAVAGVLALATASLEAVSATIHVDAERRGETIEVRASALLGADAATAWRVLTEYERYVEFIPDLRASRVVARRGNIVTVEQSGDAKLWLFRLPLDMTFEIEEIPPGRIRSRAIAGSMRALTSDYALVAAGDGVRLDYVGRIAPGFELFGYLEQVAVRDNIVRQFQALVDEIERQGAGPAARRPIPPEPAVR